jgi:hypothetical protein
MTAPGTITQAVTFFRNPNFAVLTLTCVGSADDGSFPSTALSADTLTKIGDFFIAEVRTYPGNTQPTSLYDIVFNDSGGLDLMGGNLVDRSASAAQRVFPLTYPVPIADDMTVVITNNSVHSALVTIKIFLIKQRYSI